MKKLFAIILAMALLLCGAAMADEAATEISGRWELTGMTRGDQTVDAAALEAAGVVMIFDLYADGTLDAVNGDEQMPGEWTVSGNCVTISLEGDPLDFYLVDGHLESDDSIGFVMILTRTGDVEAVESVDTAAFVGHWVMTSAAMGEQVMDAAALEANGMAMIIDLHEGGVAWANNGYEQLEGTWAAEGDCVTVTIDDDPLDFYLVDGQLQSDDSIGVVMTLTRTGDVEQAAAPEDLVGRWELTGAMVGDEARTAEELDGITMIIDLFEDGSATGDNGFMLADGSWMVDGNDVIITMAGAEMPFQLVDGQLFSNDGSDEVIILTRTGDVEEVVPVDTAAFVGHWVMTSAAMGEQVMDAEALEAAGMTMIIDLHEGGVAWANNGYQQLEGSWAAEGDCVTVTIDDDPLDFYLVDGHLESDDSIGVVMTLTRTEE